MGARGELYILTGQKPLEFEGMEKLVLLSIQASKRSLGAWSATDMEIFGGLSGIVIRDLSYFFELLHHARLTDINSRLRHAPVKYGHKRQCQKAASVCLL